MPHEVRIPFAARSYRGLSAARWLVAEGDAIASGEPLLEIETDRASMELPIDVDGRVARLCVADGTLLEENLLLAVIALPGEDFDEVRASYP